MEQAKMLAELKCEACQGTGGEETGVESMGLSERVCCGACEGSGLKYPGLSRECPCGGKEPTCDMRKEEAGYDWMGTPDCKGAGRIEAVTLETAMDVADQTEWSIDFNPPTHTKSEKWECSLDNGARTLEGNGDTALDALCAALAQMVGK